MSNANINALANSSESSGMTVPHEMMNLSSVINSTNLSYFINYDNTTVGKDKDPFISLVVPAVMFASGVLGNLLAIVVLVRSSSEHKHTVFYRLVGALACTDLFGTCATSPVTLAVYANGLKWVGGVPLCNYESFMLIFAGYATICIIGIMALDRFLAILCPFFYNTNVSPGRAKYIVIGIWSFAAFMGCLPIMGLGENINQFPGSWCFFNFTSVEVKNQIFAYMYVAIGLLVIVGTAISNIVVSMVLLKMRRKAVNLMNISNAKTCDRELHMMILLMGIIAVFATCWTPFLIRILINQIHEKQIDVKTDLFTLRLASLNQILDPWVYILFRKCSLIKAFKCLKLMVCEKCQSLCADDIQCGDERGTLRNGKSAHVPFIKYERDYVHINGENEYINVNQCDDQSVKELNNTQSNVEQEKQPSPENLNSQIKTEEKHEEMSELLRVSKGRNSNLHMKHSACLFCFANHPRMMALSSKAESKSMDKLNLLDELPCTHVARSRPRSGLTCLHADRRESIHMSLTDLNFRGDECVS